MNRYAPPRRATGALALGAALLVSPLVIAQDDDEEEVFELSPFTVEGSQDQGYRATSTLAGTRIRTDLKDVGSAISVITEEFLRDTDATDNQSLLVYAPSTEVSGTAGNFAGGGDGGRVDTDSQRLRPNASTRVRGLAAADLTRNYFRTDIPWDSFNVDRIDLQRGANSILFGLGSPAGVIEASTNVANYENAGEAKIRFDDYGSLRFELDYNQVLIEDELAVRFAALNESQKFMQDEAFEDDERMYMSLKWEPKALTTDSSRTTFEFSYETGEIDANRPRIIPPIDRITPWFTEMGKASYVTNNIQNDIESPVSDNYTPWVGAALGRIFDGPIAVFEGPNVGTQSYYMIGQDDSGAYRGINSYETYAQRANGGAGLPGAALGVYKGKTLTDPTIFDFYNHLIDGPNKSEMQEWDAYNLSISHNMLDNKLGFKLDLDNQDYADGQSNVLDAAGQSLSVDIMSVIPNGTAAGQPNPNFGRPFIGGNSGNNSYNSRERENFRLSAYYTLDFTDSNNDSLANILGKHNFSAVYADSEFTQKSYSWTRAAAANWVTDNDITQASRYIANVVYLGPSLAGANSAAGANLSPLQSLLVPQDGGMFVEDGEYALDVWSAPGGDIENLYTGGNFSRNETESKVIVWQGHMFDGMVVPLFGYREDTDVATNAGNIPTNPNVQGGKLPFSSDWQLPNSPADANGNVTYNEVSGINRTAGLVIHSPQALKDALGGWNVSLTYSDSENFRADAGRRDVLGNPLAAASGETTEMGFLVTSPDSRFSLRVNKFDTKVFNDTLSSSSIPNSYMIGAGEGWGYLFGSMAAAGVDEFWRNFALNNPEDPTSGLIDPSVTMLRYQPNPGQSVAEAFAEEQAALAAILNPANNTADPQFQQFLTFWNQDWAAIDANPNWGSGGAAWAGEPSTFAVTGDTASEGYEYELFWQPSDNWNITLNASKTDAKRLNIAESYAVFVEDRKALYDTAYGDVRLWGPWAGGETIRSKWNAEFFSNYTLFRLLNDSNVAELRPWRWNLVSNYSFNDGKLAGLNVGGAWRWQDEVVTGYRVVADSSSSSGFAFDVDDPYMGSSESNFDLWAGYTTELNDDVTWRVQLNIRNAFEDERLIPITVQPDGSPATSRIADGQSWSITNTFTF